MQVVVGRSYLPVYEESCQRYGSEGKVDAVVGQELQLPLDVLLLAVQDHVVERDVPQHVQQAAQHADQQDPN